MPPIFSYGNRYNTGVPSDPLASGPLTPDEFSSVVTAITSAFGDPTRRQIYLFAHEHTGGVTAAEVAQHFELHTNVARHHLDKLAAGGYLDVHVERGGNGSAGRPSKRYGASERAMAVDLPVRQDDMVITLLARTLALLPRDVAESMAEEVGYEYGQAMAQSLSPDEGQRSFRTALRAVADALTAHGFAAHTETRGGSLAIVSEHCPFGVTAVSSPVICAVDRGMVRGMLSALYGESTTETASSRAQGDTSCVTSVVS